MKKFAFTLAEVLITLTIIGVIAAITIPNLMQNYKRHIVEVKVKEAYSILSNMYKMGQRETDMNSSDLITYALSNWSNGEKYLHNNYFKPYLRIEKDCSGDWGQAIAGNIEAGKSSCSKVFIPQIKRISGTSSPDSSRLSYRYILSNGMYVGFTFWGNYSQYMVYVDIDGSKGEGRMGKDIFMFTINSSGFGNSWGTCGNAKYLGGSGGYNNSGYGCANHIMKNGWKIPDDYPVKKF